jgi:hypothetical protein
MARAWAVYGCPQIKEHVRFTSIKLAILGVLLVPVILQAQVSFDIDGHEVQVHGFVSEGYAATSDNNFLRMDTTNGSFFTELGVNASIEVFDKLRLGAQGYQRDIGELGDGKVYLDWLSADYRWKDWLGVRAGKVKTSFGLYTDTQDHEFLHTWALLPQSVYPADLRAVIVGHVGADIYGNLNLKRGGSVSYTLFTGTIPHDPRGGFVYGTQAQGLKLTGDIEAKSTGGDIRWTLPVPGLMLGGSAGTGDANFRATRVSSPIPVAYSSNVARQFAGYGEYTAGNFHAAGEYRNLKRNGDIRAQTGTRPVVARPGSAERAWFVSAAYRFSKWLEGGSYYSRYRVTLVNPLLPVTGPGRDHIYDKVATIRLDPSRFWDIKIEGHFMDGVGSPVQAHGFYPQDNPRGLSVKTNMLVIRTGLYF